MASEVGNSAHINALIARHACCHGHDASALLQSDVPLTDDRKAMANHLPVVRRLGFGKQIQRNNSDSRFCRRIDRAAAVTNARVVPATWSCTYLHRTSNSTINTRNPNDSTTDYYSYPCALCVRVIHAREYLLFTYLLTSTSSASSCHYRRTLVIIFSS